MSWLKDLSPIGRLWILYHKQASMVCLEIPGSMPCRGRQGLSGRVHLLVLLLMMISKDEMRIGCGEKMSGKMSEL